MNAIGVIDKTASADILANTVKGRLMELHVDCEAAIDSKSMNFQVRQTAGGDTGAIICAGAFGVTTTAGTPTGFQSGQSPRVYNFRPSGVAFSAGLRLFLAPGAAGTNTPQIHATAIYEPDTGAA